MVHTNAEQSVLHLVVNLFKSYPTFDTSVRNDVLVTWSYPILSLLAANTAFAAIAFLTFCSSSLSSEFSYLHTTSLGAE